MTLQMKIKEAKVYLASAVSGLTVYETAEFYDELADHCYARCEELAAVADLELNDEEDG